MFQDDVYLNGSTPVNVDSAFRKIKKHWTAFLIWRVDEMNLTALPKDQFGIFNDEDSYLIYSASQPGQSSGVDTVSREIKEQLEYHAHFWLGRETTPNKSGVAAFKTVELDNILNGIVTQHRETQDYESSRFKSYFKNGMRIIKPIIPAKISPFPKLYRVKGKCCPILTEISEITWTSFNSSSILLLHTDKFLFLWVGRSSNSTERIHALKIAEELKVSTPNTEIVFVDDGYEKTLSQEYKMEFDKIMPLNKRLVLPDSQENGHAIVDDYHIRLYKCSENEGKYKVTEIKDGPLKQKDLNSDGVFIIDQGLVGIWIWVGKRSSNKEKTEALRNARGFVKKKKYPSYTRVTRVVDSYEPNEFKFLFSSWKIESITNGKTVKPTIMVSKFDAQAMEDRPALAAETQLIDNGSGIVTLWRVDNPRISEIPKERHGYFFAGDCYIILYSYVTKREKHLLYYWLGNDATQEDIDCTIQKLSQIENDFQKIGFQGRVIQGYEPAHFLQIFQGKLMIFQGKGASFESNGKSTKYPSQFLVQTYGTTKYESKAVQVPFKCTSLNSNYCFVLLRGKHSFIWCGQYSNGDQREMAKGFIRRDIEIILEGKEKQEFFDLLGGKTTYKTEINKNKTDSRGPRLFSSLHINGEITVEEIYQYTQKNLIPEDIMILDAYDTLYIWIGNLSTKEDQRLSLKSAIDYLQMDPAGRNMNIPIIQVKQAEEPPTFTGFFPSWNKKYWKHYRTFPRLRRDIEMLRTSNGDIKTNGDHSMKIEYGEFDQYDKYPLNCLLIQNDKLPARVDPLKKELHLTHDDFLSVFKMSYTDFQKLPKWKQQEMKKKVKLF